MTHSVPDHYAIRWLYSWNVAARWRLAL